jgi:hypothetical protein
VSEVNYKQTNVNGESWQRAVEVTIYNPLEQTPKVRFLEETVYLVNGKVIKERASAFNSLDSSFNLNDPLHLEVYDVLNRLYIQLREARDLANQPVEPDEVPPTEPEPEVPPTEP